MLWVHKDCRMQGLGQQMLEAAAISPGEGLPSHDDATSTS